MIHIKKRITYTKFLLQSSTQLGQIDITITIRIKFPKEFTCNSFCFDYFCLPSPALEDGDVAAMPAIEGLDSSC